MRIGLYGGTFDPPHKAHIKLARWVRDKLDLEYVYFIPAALHALKNNSEVTPAEIRYRMVQMATEMDPQFKVSGIELARKGISFTVDTLREFLEYENLPEADLYYIIGIDNLYDFHRWKDPAVIKELATVVVIQREGGKKEDIPDDLKKNVLFLDSPIIDISATEIREEIMSGIYDENKVSEAVLNMIRELKLYRSAF